MSWMEGDEQQAVARARDGDREAFRALVERHSPAIFRLGYRMMGNEHDAEEIVQETFLRAFRALRRFASRSSFGTWIYRIAVNCSYDAMRKRQRQGAHAEGSVPDGDEVVRTLPAENPGPDRLVQSLELRQGLQAAFARLSPTERAAFSLRHYEGLSIEEIGRALGLRTSATKNSIFRAVRKLRESLQPLVRAK